jgi:hypothetical protein
VTPELDTDGVLRATHDLKLKVAGDEMEDSIRHGMRDEPGR